MNERPVPEVTGFLALALTRGVVLAALRIALVVGSILALINHGGAILELSFTRSSLLQIVLTYMVPYSVSTYSSVRALQRHAIEYPEKHR